MSALDVLRQIKISRRAAGQQKVVEWGNADFINDVGIENLSRRELRNHLEARDLDTNGNRLELIDRLRASIADEQLHKFAYVETIDTEFLIQADLEERGSVYACGSNSKGELGMGDMNPRQFFVPIPSLRGLNVHYVNAGVDMCYAITEEDLVYVWGGGGTGRNGVSYITEKKTNNTINIANWLEPMVLNDLAGEGCVSVTAGSSHTLAAGRGGDCLLWGDNNAGQLGLGDFENHHNVSINNSFAAVIQVAAGANHSVILTKTGQVYSWGHAGNGRLGVGSMERVGAPERERCYFPIPQLIKTLEPIKQVSCGADHTLAYGPSGVWSWGCGSGGKLGIGDSLDRADPCIVPRLKGKFVSQVIAGCWHSMALVQYPPMLHTGGWVYTWGSGYHGQLAQGSKQTTHTPELVTYFSKLHILIKLIASGSHHSAAVTQDGELYTWGSNANGCLGRKIEERDVVFTPKPGIVGGFGALVNRVGRGIPRMVACGKEFTLLCTHPYTGPDLAVATKLMEEAKIREQEAMLAKKTSSSVIDDDGVG